MHMILLFVSHSDLLRTTQTATTSLCAHIITKPSSSSTNTRLMKNITWLEFGPDISVSWKKPLIQIYKTRCLFLESINTLKHNAAVLLTSTSAPINKLSRTPADALMDFSCWRRAREPIKANINLTFTFGMNHSRRLCCKIERKTSRPSLHASASHSQHQTISFSMKTVLI